MTTVPGSLLLTGPVSPRDVAPLLTGVDRATAASLAGYRGIPVSELAHAHVDAGLYVELVTVADEIDEPICLQGDRLRLHVVPMRARARARGKDLFRAERRALQSVIASCEAPILHAHWTYEFAWAALASGRTVVVTAHDAPLTVLRHNRDRYRAMRALMAYAVRTRIRTLTAVSPYLADQWRRQMLFRSQISVIPNSAPALDGSRRTAGPDSGGARIVDVTDAGRLKNVEALVRAFRLLRAGGRDVALDLVGPGLGAGEAFAAAMGREGSCEGMSFRGPVDRGAVGRLLAGASVFVHPSFEECCSMAVLEAMSAGLPVVAGETAGGTPWMLDHGAAGLLVDVRDPRSIAEGVAAMLDDRERAAIFVERGLARVGSMFSPAVVAAAYMDVYERALAKRR